MPRWPTQPPTDTGSTLALTSRRGRNGSLAAPLMFVVVAAGLMAPPAVWPRSADAGEARAAGVDTQTIAPGEVPAGLSGDAWSDIQQQIAAARYEAAPIAAEPDTVGAHNPDQDLRLRFDGRGAHVESVRNRNAQSDAPPAALQLQTLALARGAQRHAVATVAPAAEGQRIEYRHDGWTEWYHNTAAGLEHGYTLQERPLIKPVMPAKAGIQSRRPRALHRWIPASAGMTDAPVRFELSVTGMRASQAGDALRFTDAAGRSLHYGKLLVLNADGKTLPATLTATAEDRIEIAFNDSQAKYPVIVDPLLINEEQFIPNPGGDFDGSNWNTGQAVAIDGDTLIIGAPREGARGAAYVFVRGSDGLWQLQQRLSPVGTFSSDVRFGVSVALDGDTAVIGAFLDTIDGKAFQGSAFVFVRSGANWSLQQKLLAPDGEAGDRFGRSVALSGDTALVGAYQDDVGANADQGSAWVFVRSGTSWSVQQSLVAGSGAANDAFGFAVALDGDTAVIGSNLDDVNGNVDQGSAYVFVRSGTSWTVQQQLLAADGAAGDNLGVSVAVEGDTALLGAHRDDVGGNVDQGSAHVFVRSGTTWSLQGNPLVKPFFPELGDQFGRSVALSGNTALIGANLDDFISPDQGSALVFVREGTSWTFQTSLSDAEVAGGGQFGYAVALDGDTALIGAWLDDVDGSTDQGSARIFTRSGSSWSEGQSLTAISGAANDQFGSAVALSSNTMLVGVPLDDVAGKADQGAAYVYVRANGIWTQQARLIAADGAAGDQFGMSVALDGNTALIGASFSDPNLSADRGAAYVFTRDRSTWSQQQKLVAADGDPGDGFGGAVALDGGTALIGAAGDDSNRGAAYVFQRLFDSWSQQQKLDDSNGVSGDKFGNAAALDGDTALISAIGRASQGSSIKGSAYFFVRSGGNWTLQSSKVASDGGTAFSGVFGTAVALGAETALVGGSRVIVNENTASLRGEAHLYTRLNGVWSLQQVLTPNDPHGGFGNSIAVDGRQILIGAPATSDPFGGFDAGVAYLFTPTATTWTERANLFADVGAVDLEGDTALIGLPNTSVDAGAAGGAVRVVRFATDYGDAPAPYPTLLANDGARHDIDSDGLRLGMQIDSESDGQPSVDASLDDLNGDDDEDGVSFGPLAAGTNGSITVTVNAPAGPAKLSAWIDFNRDGDWSDAGERILDAINVSTGMQMQSFLVPLAAVSGQTFARVRLSTDGVTGPTGFAADGEVEDHAVTILGADSDGDGIPNDWETANGLDPNNPNDAGLDPDNDGLSNLEEFNTGTDPQNADTDGDGIGDGIDAEPAVASNACMGMDAVFENTLVPGGTVAQCAASTSATVESTVTVEPGGRVEVLAPQTHFQPGFTLPGGAELGVVPAAP